MYTLLFLCETGPETGPRTGLKGASMSKTDVYVKRRSWGWDEKRAIVAASLDGSISVAALARRHGLQTHQIYNWRHVLSALDGPCEFLKVEVVAADEVSKVPPTLPSAGGGEPTAIHRHTPAHVEIGLPGGVSIRVPVSAGSGFVSDISLSLSRGLS